MGVNIDQLRNRQEEYNRKSDITAVKSGDTVYYVHPPCRDNDEDKITKDMPFLRVRVHYGVGANNNMVVCLDKKRNPILSHPFIRHFLKKRNIDISGGQCPVCNELNRDSIDADSSNRIRGQFKYLWGVTPIKYRLESQHKFEKVEHKQSVIMTGKTVYEGLMELFYDNGDITDPKYAILAQVRKTGKGAFHTKYKVSADNASLKKPLVLPEGFRNAVFESFKHQCDLFRVISDMVRDEKDISALFAGVPLEEESVDDLDSDGWGMEEPEEGKKEESSAVEVEADKVVEEEEPGEFGGDSTDSDMSDIDAEMKELLGE